MSAPYIDIHTHGQFTYEENEVIFVKSLGVTEIAEGNAQGFFSAGIHPWWTLDYTKLELATFQESIVEMNLHQSLFAVGETGLDRVYKETLDEQKELFSWHIDFSEKNKLPLIIHSVRAGSDILEFLKDKKPTVPWIFHDFRGNKELVDAILKLHPTVYFSFGISLDNSQAIRELIREMPLEHIFLETDAQKHLDIRDIYLRASEQLGIDKALLKSIIAQNFKRVCLKN